MDLQHKVVISQMSEFKDRLLEACKDSPDIPDYGKGLQVQLAKMMGVSQEAVRKWLSGDTRPKHEMCRKLANVLNVNYVWLELGTTEDEIAKVRKVARRQDAGVHAYISYLMESNFNVAFPSSDDDLADIHAVGRGVHISARVYSGTLNRGTYTVKFPAVSEDYAWVAACRIPDVGSLTYDFFTLDADDIRQGGERQGSGWVIRIRKNEDGDYMMNGEVIYPKVLTKGRSVL